MLLYAIGHSNRTLAEFLSILKQYEILHVIDIRTIPKSRYVPWTNQSSLKKTLNQQDLHYTHMPQLGGLRKPKLDSRNQGWKNTGFRGFADYMNDPAFFQALKILNECANKMLSVIMCAEAVPWRCHRLLISDAEIIRHVKIIHIINQNNSQPHELTAFAVVERDKKPMQIIYPEKNFQLNF